MDRFKLHGCDIKKRNSRLLFGLFLIIGLQSLQAQITLPLYDKGIPNNKAQINATEIENSGKLSDGRSLKFIRKIITPEIYVYLPKPNIKNTGKAVIICPGGGYTGLAIDHEGHEIAQKLNEHGIAGIVLKYRCPDTSIVENKSVVPLQDVHRAIQLVKSNAAKWKIKTNKIGIMGSSAGGHLASTAATHYLHTDVPNPEKTNLRPDFAILNYPVISFADSVTHKGSRSNLIQQGENIDPALVEKYSNELQVNANTPPVYITHAVDDNVVPVANTLLFIAACQQYGVPVTSFFYNRGGHGYGIKNPTAKKQWIDDCIQWIRGR